MHLDRFSDLKMALVNQVLQNAVDYYRARLIVWYESKYGQHIQDYDNLNLRIIGSFYGFEKLLQEYREEMMELWVAMEVVDSNEMDDLGNLDLNDTQWANGVHLPRYMGYSGPKQTIQTHERK